MATVSSFRIREFFKKYAFIILAVFFFAIPFLSNAAIWDSVGCSGVDCQACHLAQLANSTVNFLLIDVAAPLTTLVFAYAGFLMFTARGNEQQVSSAKTIFSTVLIGIIVVLAAWLIVDTIMRILLREDFGPWNEIRCVDYPIAADVPAATPPSEPGPTTPLPATTDGCSGCVAFPGGFPAKTAAQNGCSSPPDPSGGNMCIVSSDLYSRLNNLVGVLNGYGIATNQWWVTEAWPPTRTHSNPCHQNGTCVDANFRIAATNARIVSFLQAAQTAGLRAVYEVSSAAARDAIINSPEFVASGLAATSVANLGSWISGPHFSVYCSSCSGLTTP